MTAFETIPGRRTSEKEVMVVGVAAVIVVAEVAATLDKQQVELAEGRPKGNHLARYSNNLVLSC